MASIFAPLLLRPEAPTFKTPRSTTTLLNLDCSADLRSYSRNLGPAAQARAFTLSSDLLRAQFESHREHLLRHRQQTARPSLAHPGPTHGANASVPEHLTNFRDPHHQAVAARPTYQPLATIHPQQRTSSPKLGDVSTYPTALRQALERSKQLNAAEPGDNSTVYHVVEDVTSEYMDDSSDVLGAYRDMHSANVKAAEHFLAGDAYACGEEPVIQLTEDGRLQLEIEADGSAGGFVSVYVRRGKLNR